MMLLSIAEHKANVCDSVQSAEPFVTIKQQHLFGLMMHAHV